jgi:hypothetical protein
MTAERWKITQSTPPDFKLRHYRRPAQARRPAHRGDLTAADFFLILAVWF